MRSFLVRRAGQFVPHLFGMLGLFVAEFDASAQTTTAAAWSEQAVDGRPRDVSLLIQPILEKHEIPGMVAATVDVDGVKAMATVGVRENGKDQQVAVEDSFHLGSCTKAMTATLLAMLVADGKLQWSTTVGEVFTEFGDRMDPQWQAVSLELLLQHRSGASANLDANGLWARLCKQEGTPTAQRMTLVEGVVTRPPQAAPGSKYIYSNAGYAIAGAMAERVTGQSWEDLMRTRLFEPLGMTSAGFGAPGTAENIDQPRGHDEQGNPVSPSPRADNPPAIGPAGTVHCSIGDWARFVRLHMPHAVDRPLSLDFSQEPFVRLHRPVVAPGDPAYAMGWMVMNRSWAAGSLGDSDIVLNHNGSNTMWFSTVWLADEFAVLVICNQGGDSATKACDEAASALIQDYLKQRSAPATSPAK